MPNGLYQKFLPGPGSRPGPEIWRDWDMDQGGYQKYDGTGTGTKDLEPGFVWDQDRVQNRDHDQELDKDL